MTRYIWMIHTAEADPKGTLGDVYLSIHGLSATTREIKLPARDYEADTVESGTVAVRGDLGELQTALLRTSGAERSAWTPDWVKVTNLADGRQWTAQGGACSSDGSCPLLRFERTWDSAEKQKSDEPPAGSDSAGKASGDKGTPQSAATVTCTYEVFGKSKGRVVPIADILKIRDGVKQLAPGGQIFITQQDSQGFGLGGEPGLWNELYPGVSPAVYGLEPDMAVMASDGSRGWVLDAHYLAMIFGAEWRRVVYGK